VIGLTTQQRSTYPEPTFEEMMGLAVDFGIISAMHSSGNRVKMEVLNEMVDLTMSEAAVLLKGLLLGYFYNQKRDDLSLARWES
jgi:hypothetical protein